jgi:hypothetical protein
METDRDAYVPKESPGLAAMELPRRCGRRIGAALSVPMSIWLENAIIPAAAGLVAIVIGGYRPACALVARKPAGSR